MKYVLQVYRRYAAFQGRARRREYWSFVAFFAVIVVGATLLARPEGSAQEILVSMVLGLFALASVVPALALRIRRLHDINRTGFWVFIALLPVIGELVLVVFALLPGTNGPNRFGADPKKTPGDEVDLVFG